MKKNFPVYLLILALFAGLVLSGCATKSERLLELEKTQKQMQKEISLVSKEANEAKQKALRYDELAHKYQMLVAKKNEEVNSLQETYTEIDKKEETQAKTVKKVLENKLIESAQDSVHLEKRLKRYTEKAKAYKEKSQELDEKAKQTEEYVEKTNQEIQQVKKEIAKEKQASQENEDG